MLLFRPGVSRMYNIYGEDKPETYWVHFTGSDVELLLDYYRMPKNENVFSPERLRIINGFFVK